MHWQDSSHSEFGLKSEGTCVDVYKRQELVLPGHIPFFSDRTSEGSILVAVSYTHLDVYKRQVELTAPRWPRSAMFSFMVWKVGMKMPQPKPMRMAEV